jgi:hypothetical protein
VVVVVLLVVVLVVLVLVVVVVVLLVVVVVVVLLVVVVVGSVQPSQHDPRPERPPVSLQASSLTARPQRMRGGHWALAVHETTSSVPTQTPSRPQSPGRSVQHLTVPAGLP